MHPSGKGTNTSYSPIFNSYFNTNLAEIAARVTTEFTDGDGDCSDDFNNIHSEDKHDNGGEDPEIGCEDDRKDHDDFEFDLSTLMPENGEIRPVYPLFNQDLLKDLYLVGEIESRPTDSEEECYRAQVQVKNLFLQDCDLDPPSSSSSSEADELEENEIPPGTYCVWAANKSPAASPSPGRCTKSNSTGSSASVSGKAKAWKLRDFLKRSKSDGKEGLMLLTPKKKVESSAAASSSGGGGKQVRVRDGKTAAACELYYGGAWSREGVENKWKSYLPYKQDLVGLFASSQGLRKMHLPPFWKKKANGDR